MIRGPRRSPLFPSTPLSRSRRPALPARRRLLRRRADAAPDLRQSLRQEGTTMNRRTTDVAELGTVLGVWAHPDDEAYLRSEEHTSELQSRQYIVCRLLLDTK